MANDLVRMFKRSEVIWTVAIIFIVAITTIYVMPWCKISETAASDAIEVAK